MSQPSRTLIVIVTVTVTEVVTEVVIATVTVTAIATEIMVVSVTVTATGIGAQSQLLQAIRPKTRRHSAVPSLQRRIRRAKETKRRCLKLNSRSYRLPQFRSATAPSKTLKESKRKCSSTGLGRRLLTSVLERIAPNMPAGSTPRNRPGNPALTHHGVDRPTPRGTSRKQLCLLLVTQLRRLLAMELHPLLAAEHAKIVSRLRTRKNMLNFAT